MGIGNFKIHSIYTEMTTSWSLFNTHPQTSRDKLFAKYVFHMYLFRANKHTKEFQKIR